MFDHLSPAAKHVAEEHYPRAVGHLLISSVGPLGSCGQRPRSKLPRSSSAFCDRLRMRWSRVIDHVHEGRLRCPTLRHRGNLCVSVLRHRHGHGAMLVHSDTEHNCELILQMYQIRIGSKPRTEPRGDLPVLSSAKSLYFDSTLQSSLRLRSTTQGKLGRHTGKHCSAHSIDRCVRTNESETRGSHAREPLLPALLPQNTAGGSRRRLGKGPTPTRHPACRG